MRKQHKVKRHSCKVCKTHKMGWDNRWKPREKMLARLAEKEIRRARRAPATREH